MITPRDAPKDDDGVMGSGASMVCIEVEDDGPGLTAAERGRATQRFWRSPAHQNIDGTGLGLTIACVLAEASGGRLELLPGESGGLLARLVLPVAALGSPGTDAADTTATADTTDATATAESTESTESAGQMSGFDSR